MKINIISAKLYLRWLRFKILNWTKFVFARDSEENFILFNPTSWKNDAKKRKIF